MRLVLLLLVGLSACTRGPRSEAPAMLMTVQRNGAAAFAVFPARGVQLNAQQPPRLEIEGTEPLRIDRGTVTRDSAYFAEPPWIPRVTAFRGEAHLRVSYCRTPEAVCQSERLAIHVEP
ncbi:MAG: hypothetical protein ABI679_16045 [Gemmatimonadota bacterium]